MSKRGKKKSNIASMPGFSFFRFFAEMTIFACLTTIVVLPVTSACAAVGITVDVTESSPQDIVSGTVSGLSDFDQVYAVVFVRTDMWYPQPNQSGFYLTVASDGRYETATNPWKQVAVFVIDRSFDAWNGHNAYDPFPLEVDGANVLAVGAYPSVNFAGYQWAVKGGDNLQPPGPSPAGCDYHAGTESVWVDGEGRLHLKLDEFDTDWRCAEVYLPPLLGFGVYHFLVESRVDQLDKNLVASPFLYRDEDNELDIEFSSWAEDPPTQNAQFVVQPYQAGDNRHRFDMALDNEQSTHIIDWREGPAGLGGQVGFVSMQGHHGAVLFDQIIEGWIVISENVPVDETLRVHMNLWAIEGSGPSDGQPAEMIVKDFAFYKTACECPETGDWTVSESCTLTADAAPAGDVIVDAGATLDFVLGAALQMDWTGHSLVINGAVALGRNGKIQ